MIENLNSILAKALYLKTKEDSEERKSQQQTNKNKVKKIGMKMTSSFQQTQLALALLVALVVVRFCAVEAGYRDQCYFNWGGDKGRAYFTGPDSLELNLKKIGGGALISRASYLYGRIESQIKLVPGNSAGTVTTFYLYSFQKNHDEIDYEFLGNETGKPYTLHTNIFTQGKGDREMQFKLWFDPTSAYHTYGIQWTPYSVVWYVDNTPIRVFRNFHDKEINYPNSQAMYLKSSLWNGEDWATQGGRVKTDWKKAPFRASFRGLKTNACQCDTNSKNVKRCNSKRKENWWTDASKYRQLSSKEYFNMKFIQNNYMIYNYCTDFKRFKGKMAKECSKHQN